MAGISSNARPSTLLILVAFSSLLGLGLAALCENSEPIPQKAYVGPYALDFPIKSRGRSQPSRCVFRIQTYRKDYVIQLQFVHLSLMVDRTTGSCLEKVTVYDGPTIASNVIASFCSGTPELVTSSDEALIVFSSPNDHLASSSSTLFTMKYRAVVERRDSGDTSHILRIGFGSFIGAIAFIVICSGVCRKYKLAHPERSFFQFGGSGQSRGSVSSSGSTSGARRVRGAQQPSRRQQENVSLRGKITGFFEAILIKLTPARFARETESSASTGQNGATLTPQEQLRRAGQAVHLRNNRSRYSIDGGRESSTGTSTGLDNEMSSVDIIGTVSPEGVGDHTLFGYQHIPTSSFTSDPAAVKPPTYEEVVNNVNPMYLYQHHGTYSNPVFNMKDEPTDPTTAFSPPPPYSEFLVDTVDGRGLGRGGLISTPPSQAQGVDTVGTNGHGFVNVGQGQRHTTPTVSPETSSEVARSVCASPRAPTRVSRAVPSAPILPSTPSNAPFQDGATSDPDRHVTDITHEVGKQEQLFTNNAPLNFQATDPSSNSGVFQPTPSSTSIPTAPLSPVTSAGPSRASGDGHAGSSLPSDDNIGVVVARPREAGRDTDITVGVGGAKLHKTAAEIRPPVPLTPVYLSQYEEEASTPRRLVDTPATATNLHSLSVTQVNEGGCDDDTQLGHTQDTSGGTLGQERLEEPSAINSDTSVRNA